MSLTKQALRQEVLAWRRTQTKPIEISDTLCHALLKWIKEQEITSVGLYHAMQGEVDVSPLKALFDKHGIICALPIVYGDDEMFFQQIDSETKLYKQSYGFLAPEMDKSKEVVPDLLLIPGLSFDIKGNRLGYGKGHYDRYLAKFNAVCVGVCASAQLRAELPTESHDKAMAFVITEEKMVLL